MDDFDLAEPVRPLQSGFFLYSMINFVPLINPLLKILKPESVCEIGIFSGDMTAFLCNYCKKNNAEYFGVDIRIKENLKNQFNKQFIKLIESDSFSYLENNQLHDLYFVDTEHNYYTVSNELRLINKKVNNDSKKPIIFIHDLGWPTARRDSYNNGAKYIPKDFVLPHSNTKMIGIDKKYMSDRGVFAANESFGFAHQYGGKRNGVLTAVEDFVKENNHWQFIFIPGFFGLGIIYLPEYLEENILKEIKKIEEFCRYGHDYLSTMEYNRLDILAEVNQVKNEFTKKLESINKKSKQNKEDKKDLDFTNINGYWKKDASLLKIDKYLRENDCKYVFIDCFDTLVKRLSPSPALLFREVGKRLEKENILINGIDPDGFIYMRLTAEKKANNLHSSSPFLINIYEELSKILLDYVYASQIELAVEKDYCYLNLYLTDFIKHLHEKGYKIILVSDTYFSSKQIRDILESIGFENNYLEKVITSCEEVSTKYKEGNLFKIALEELKIKNSEVIHLGDNEKSDFINASLKGIKSFHYLNNLQHIRTKTEIQKRENFFSRKEHTSASFSSLRILNTAMSEHIPDEFKKYHQIGSFIFAPIFSRFADWSLEQMIKKNIKQVLVLMREGELFGKMLKNCAKSRGYEIEITPLYISRTSSLFCIFSEEKPSKIFDIIPGIDCVSASKAFENFNLKELMFLFKEVYPGYDLDQELKYYELMNLAEKIIKNKKLRDKALELAKSQREKLIKYIKPLLKENNIALLDIGYGGTVQQNLKEIFEIENIDIKLSGYYFIPSISSVDRVLSGLEMYFYLGYYGNNVSRSGSTLNNPILFEEIANGCIGSTKSYEYNENSNSVEPVLDNLEYPEEEKKKKYFLQKGIYDFQEYWLQIYQQKRKKVEEEDLINILREIDESSIGILHRFSTFPTQEESLLFANFTDSNYRLRIKDHKTAIKLIDKSYIDLYREKNLDGLFDKICQWPQGVASVANPLIIEQFFYIWETFNCLR